MARALDRRRTAMTRRGIRLATTAALFVVLAPAAAFAQTGTIADWGPDSYAWETSYGSPTAYVSNAGSLLNAVGVVTDFAGPLAGLEPIPAGQEYTYWMTNLVSGGTTITPGGFANTYRTVYTTTNPGGSNIGIWTGPTNASFGTNPPNATAPSTFNDGVLVLSGRFTQITVTFIRRNSDQVVLSGNADTGTPSVANGVFDGGSALPLVSTNGQPCPFRVTGGWLARAGAFPAGYSAHFDGKIDIDCPTPAETSTWGRVKGQYR
jgi:hypothetical protein